MNRARYQKGFVKAVQKQKSLLKDIEKQVLRIREYPEGLGKPLKENLRGFCSSKFRQDWRIVYLYCAACRRKGDDAHVACADCAECPDELIKFVYFGHRRDVYRIGS